MRRDKRDHSANGDHYNPAKARVYRETFQDRDPQGRTWNERIAEWRKDHPEYRSRSADYAKKSRQISKLRLKKRLLAWGLTHEQLRRVLREAAFEELDRIAFCLEHWEHLAGDEPRTPQHLLRIVRHDDGDLLRRVLTQVTRKDGK